MTAVSTSHVTGLNIRRVHHIQKQNQVAKIRSTPIFGGFVRPAYWNKGFYLSDLNSQ